MHIKKQLRKKILSLPKLGVLMVDILRSPFYAFSKCFNTRKVEKSKSLCPFVYILNRRFNLTLPVLDTREKDLIYWEGSNRCILECIRFTNGRFAISQPGYYYAFSQIKYKHDPESARDIHSRQSHTLHRYSLRTREQILLENTRTYAELHSPVNNGTSYIGAVLRLEMNDEIMIKSSHTHKTVW